MELVGNVMNGNYVPALIRSADCDALSEIRLAVAYVTKMDDVFTLADKRKVPLTLYALGDGDFPALAILKRFASLRRVLATAVPPAAHRQVLLPQSLALPKAPDVERPRSP